MVHFGINCSSSATLMQLAKSISSRMRCLTGKYTIAWLYRIVCYSVTVEAQRRVHAAEYGAKRVFTTNLELKLEVIVLKNTITLGQWICKLLTFSCSFLGPYALIVLVWLEAVWLWFYMYIFLCLSSLILCSSFHLLWHSRRLGIHITALPYHHVWTLALCQVLYWLVGF